MISVQLLNYLHKKGFRDSLAKFCGLAYFLRGHGRVQSEYLHKLGAYSFKVKGVTYLTMGPGWSVSFAYLSKLLTDTYNYIYMPRKGDCVIDIGAGVGEEAAIYSQLVGPEGIVYALEANPTSFAVLKYMCEQNSFVQTKVHHVAIYNLDGEVTIEDDVENYLVNTINKGNSKSRGLLVPSRTLDSFVKENNVDRIDFLKSNIEGAEQYLIQGMNRSVDIIKNICVSCHDFRHDYHNHGEFYKTKAKVTEFLQDSGFNLTVRKTGNRVTDDYIYGSKAVPKY